MCIRDRILGGTGARLEDLVGAYAALNRGGIAGRVRYTPDDPQVDRRVLSPGAAWIIREILESNPRPGELLQFDRGSRPKVAGKTDTSYGFRDAWALGGTRRYTVGVWVGRPDGTPLPGQYGAITALPLLFEVVDSLPRDRTTAVSPPPAGVAEIEICWPLGIGADQQPSALCQRRMKAWTLDGAVPPTFAERGARPVSYTHLDVYKRQARSCAASASRRQRRSRSCSRSDRRVRRLPSMKMAGRRRLPSNRQSPPFHQAGVPPMRPRPIAFCLLLSLSVALSLIHI